MSTNPNTEQMNASNNKLARYAVFGNPIEHSKSPEIHTEFARQTQQAMRYDKQLVPVGEFARAATEFFEQGGLGLNITVPFKEQAFDWVDERSEMAQRAGAVNTIVWDGQKTIGHNTDGLGMLHDIIHNHQVIIAQRRVLVLGAGGAVRGVLEPLLAARPQCVHIANRTVSKAHDLVSHFAHAQSLNQASDITLSASGYEALEKTVNEQPFDVIINGTSSGLTGDVPPLPENSLVVGGCTYDMVYANEPTAFVRWGQAHGAAQALDGLGMLVEQAAEAFALWRGIRPNSAHMIQQLR